GRDLRGGADLLQGGGERLDAAGALRLRDEHHDPGAPRRAVALGGARPGWGREPSGSQGQHRQSEQDEPAHDNLLVRFLILIYPNRMQHRHSWFPSLLLGLALAGGPWLPSSPASGAQAVRGIAPARGRIQAAPSAPTAPRPA